MPMFFCAGQKGLNIKKFEKSKEKIEHMDWTRGNGILND